MKQIILESRFRSNALGSVCLGRLAATWGLYGCAMALLWRLSGGNALAQAIVWLVALAAAAGLVFAMEGV